MRWNTWFLQDLMHPHNITVIIICQSAATTLSAFLHAFCNEFTRTAAFYCKICTPNIGLNPIGALISQLTICTIRELPNRLTRRWLMLSFDNLLWIIIVLLKLWMYTAQCIIDWNKCTASTSVFHGCCNSWTSTTDKNILEFYRRKHSKM